MAATALLKLAGFFNDLRYVDLIHKSLAQMQGMMSEYPLGFGQCLQAQSHPLSKQWEIVIVGDPDSAEAQALLSVVRDGYRPFQVAALGAPDRDMAVLLLGNRGPVDGHAAAYVCRALSCQASVAEPQELGTTWSSADG